MVRVRFAPSPTGFLHIGGARTALFNWLFARHEGGKFILRIEDTDITRSDEKLIGKIIESLKWLSIDWDEGPEVGGRYGPYFQSQRFEIYRKYAEKLLKEGKAYLCYCLPEELEARRKEMIKRKEVPRYDGRCRNLTLKQREKFEKEGRKPVIRFRWDEAVEGFQDEIHGYLDFQKHSFDDFIIIKRDGSPTYNFACVIDDHLMEITHVIRGDDHITNTPRQIAIYRAFGWTPPRFAHLPLILGPDRSRLSKRHGATDVLEYKKMGYLPEALLNYIALLGWSPDTDEEILSREELIRKFNLKGITKRNAVFNIDKLNWINSQYIKRLEFEEWKKIALKYLEEKGISIKSRTEEWWKKFLKIYQPRTRTLEELYKNSQFFFNSNYPYNVEAVEKVLSKSYVPSLLEDLKEEISEITPFTVENIENVLRESCSHKGLSGREFIHPLRVAVTGQMVSPPIFDVLFLLGKEECLRRIERTIQFLKTHIKKEE
ncbi:glutamate--tRNA ligase [Candidatus Calescamantes bacterium]|nr:glutamate--tRNA ligase [Candidatus Calescamantes bacterium]